MADALRDQTDGRDLCARVGGEEFALLLAVADDSQAAARAERLCRYLAGVVLDTPRGPLSVTVSIGVSALTADCDSLDALLAQADDRLYTAKRGGRNRVCVGA